MLRRYYCPNDRACLLLYSQSKVDDMPDDDPGTLPANIHEYYHDLQYFVGALVQLSTVDKGQESDAALLRKRLSAINGFSVIMSAKTNFLKYLTTAVYDL